MPSFSPTTALRSPNRSRASQRARMLLVALLTLLLVSGCSVGSSNEEGGSSSPTGSNNAASAQAGIPIEVVEAPGGSVLVFVEVTIQGQGPYPFVLDTGASRTTISPELVNQLNLTKSDRQSEVVGITGSEQANLVQVSEWQLAGITLPESTLVSITLPTATNAEALGKILGTDSLTNLQGLLGSDILSQFERVLIDYESERLILNVPPLPNGSGATSTPTPPR